MEDYEMAYNSAMDDTDPILVKTAMIIADSKMTHEDKTHAIWALFQDRKKKIAEEKRKRVSFKEVDERGTEEDLLPKKQREVPSPSQGVSGQE
jgi:hypothetical protein